MKPDNPGNFAKPDPTSINDNPPALESAGFGLLQHQFDIRVRYQETDAQGHAHHTTYVNYFEIGRIEMLRAAGFDYRDLENQGMMLVVTEVGCQYFVPARYDDVLRLTTTVVSSRGARIRHDYEIHRDQDLIARGFTVVAAVDRTGKVQRLPKWLRIR
jgi:acyl-CoA thioester hydrolase